MKKILFILSLNLLFISLVTSTGFSDTKHEYKFKVRGEETKFKIVQEEGGLIGGFYIQWGESGGQGFSGESTSYVDMFQSPNSSSIYALVNELYGFTVYMFNGEAFINILCQKSGKHMAAKPFFKDPDNNIAAYPLKEEGQSDGSSGFLVFNNNLWDFYLNDSDFTVADVLIQRGGLLVVHDTTGSDNTPDASYLDFSNGILKPY